MSESIFLYGTGSVSPLGASRGEVGESLRVHTQTFADREFEGRVAAIAPLSFSSTEAINELPERYQKLDRTVRMAIVASRKAVEFSRWDVSGEPLAIFLGSSRGATSILEERLSHFFENGQRVLPPDTSPLTTLGNISSWVAQDLLTTGAAVSHSVTCSTALHALGNSVAWIRAGMATRALCGGAEAALSPFTVAQMRALRIYSPFVASDNPCRPLWDEDSRPNTLVLGEGAGVLCVGRGGLGRPLAKIVGLGFAVEPIRSATSISEEGHGLSRSMARALMDAGLTQVDVVIPHAPGTRGGDGAEIAALKEVFGDIPPLTTAKHMVGHTFGASGALALELATMILNGECEMPELPYASLGRMQVNSPQTILVNAAGFGGNSVSIILQAV